MGSDDLKFRDVGLNVASSLPWPAGYSKCGGGESEIALLPLITIAEVPLSKALSPKLLTQRGGGKVEWGFMNTNWCKLTNDVSQAVQKQNKSNPCTNQWEVKTSGGNKGSNPETQDTWQQVKNRQPLKHTVGVETTVHRWNTLGKAQQLTQKHKDSK